jgi:hypothetical protein
MSAGSENVDWTYPHHPPFCCAVVQQTTRAHVSHNPPTVSTIGLNVAVIFLTRRKCRPKKMLHWDRLGEWSAASTIYIWARVVATFITTPVTSPHRGRRPCRFGHIGTDVCSAAHPILSLAHIPPCGSATIARAATKLQHIGSGSLARREWVVTATCERPTRDALCSKKTLRSNVCCHPCSVLLCVVFFL